MTSISSQMMGEISTYRNANGKNWHRMSNDARRHCPNIFKVIAAEAGYLFTFAFAIVETVAKTILLTLTVVVMPITTAPMKHAWKELKSSSFAIAWSGFDLLINPFCTDVATSEKQAWDLLVKGELMAAPNPLLD